MATKSKESKRKVRVGREVKGLDRVLLATDFSLDADRALRRASLLGYQPRATIFLVYVMPAGTTKAVESVVRGAAETRLDEAGAKLQRILTDRSRADIGLSTRVLQGDVTDTIVRFAIDHSIDVVCLGRRGASRIGEILLGTTALRVIRRGRVPVLVVNRAPVEPYRRAVIGYDFSGDSLRATRLAGRLLARSGAHVTVVHAFESQPNPLSLPGSAAARVPDLQTNRVLRQRVKMMGTSLRPLLRRSETWRPYLARGDARRVLLAKGRAHKETLLVLGSAGRTGLSRMLVGSVAESVLLRAEGDVLLVPRPG